MGNKKKIICDICDYVWEKSFCDNRFECPNCKNIIPYVLLEHRFDANNYGIT